MKKLILSFAAALVIFSIGCSKKDGDPKTVLIAFFDALGKKDVEAAKKYATKESTSMLDMMKMGMNSPEAKKDEYNKDNMEFGDAKIDGDKATVPVKDKKSGETTNFTLKKEEGQWKVAFDKASMMEMAGEKMKQGGMGDMGTDSTFQNSADSLMNNMNEGTVPATDDTTNQ